MGNHRGMHRPRNVLITKYSPPSRIRVGIDLTGSRSRAGRVEGGERSLRAESVPGLLASRGENPDGSYRTNGTYRSPELPNRSHSYRSHPYSSQRPPIPYRSFAV